MSPEEARRQARIELGGAEQVKEQVRETFGRDLRFTFRALHKKPSFLGFNPSFWKPEPSGKTATGLRAADNLRAAGVGQKGKGYFDCGLSADVPTIRNS
jgi:hypothetical protein